MIPRLRPIYRIALFATLALATSPAAAITVRIDYSTDTGNFFPADSQARATLDAVAAFYSDILDDTFDSIQTPADFVGANGTVDYHWLRTYSHPTSGLTVCELDQSIAANDYPIYVGARPLLIRTLGVGGPGGYVVHNPEDDGTFTQAEQTQREEIDSEFRSDVTMRGETSGFANWGASFTVNSTLATGLSWHFDHTTLPPDNSKVDLYSVALHEIGHALGLGVLGRQGETPTAWRTLVNPDTHHFRGPAAMAEHGSQVPLETDNKHWKEGTMSETFEGAVVQEAAMDPTLANGTRKRLTMLDATALVDLGWDIDLPASMASLAAELSGGGSLAAADLAAPSAGYASLTAASVGFTANRMGGPANLSAVATPEPGTLSLLIVGAVAPSMRRRRRRLVS